MRVIGTGLSGLVGSRIVELLGETYEFENYSLQTGVDILNKNALFEKVKNSNTSLILHLAAKTDVDACEKDKEQDIVFFKNDPTKEIVTSQMLYSAWAINVVGTKHIVQACEAFGKRLMYISTDFVFDGSNPPADGYREESITNPVNWYGNTKYEGETIVKNSHIPWTIVRIAYPYRAFFERKDFARSIIKLLQNNKKIPMVTDHIFCPTFIDDIAYALDTLIGANAGGIFHVVGNQALSPYEAALIIADKFSFNTSLINQITREEFFKNRAPRPFRLLMRNDKIQQLGIIMRSFTEGIEELKKQMLV